MSTQNVDVDRFARNDEWDFSCDFQTPCFSLAFFWFPDREWIERTIAQNDKDGDGGISLEEFIEMNISRGKHKRELSQAKSQSDIVLEKARLAFNAYDRNRDGYLTKAEMKRTSKSMTDAQIDAVFEKYDRNKDGKLDFEEFKELMESNSKSKSSSQNRNNSNASEASSSSSSAKTPTETAQPESNQWFSKKHNDDTFLMNFPYCAAPPSSPSLFLKLW